MKNSDMNFQKFPVANGTAFSGNSVAPPDKTTLRGIPNCPNGFFPSISAPLGFHPRKSGIFNRMVCLWKLINFLIFCKFPSKLPYHLSPFLNFRNCSKFFHRMKSVLLLFENNATVNLQVLKQMSHSSMGSLIWKTSFDNPMFYREPSYGQWMKKCLPKTRFYGDLVSTNFNWFTRNHKK